MKYELAIFDLDGTLLDTLSDLTNAANAALGDLGYPTRSREEIRCFIGNGVTRLIRLCLPENAPEELRGEALRRFKAHYFAHVNDETVPYPGVTQALRALRQAGVKIAVNSNKVDDAVQRLCAAHFDGLIDLALGEVEGIAKKPSPEGALHILKRLNVPPEKAVYVGDGDTDVLTAQRAGMDSLWVSWGFRHREELEGLSIPHAVDSVGAMTDYILGN